MGIKFGEADKAGVENKGDKGILGRGNRTCKGAEEKTATVKGKLQGVQSGSTIKCKAVG